MNTRNISGVLLCCKKKPRKSVRKITASKKINQGAKKVVSDSPGLVDFAIGLVNFVFNLPYRQVMFFEEFE